MLTKTAFHVRAGSSNLAALRARLNLWPMQPASLTALQWELKRMVEECSHNRVSQCRVIEVLKDIATAAPITEVEVVQTNFKYLE